MTVVKLTGETYEKTRSTPGVVLIEWHGSTDAGRAGAYDDAVGDDVVVASIDAEQEATIAAMAHVTELPMLAIYRDGYEVFTTQDQLTPDEVAAEVDRVRGLDMAEVRQQAAEDLADDQRGG